VSAEIFTNFWYFVHNFGYRYARKSFKGSRDADVGLVSEKILSHNNGPMGWAQGQVKIAKNTPTCGVPPRKPPTENEKCFFSISTTRLAESVESLNSSLAQSPGEI